MTLYPYIYPIQGGLVGAVTTLTGKARYARLRGVIRSVPTHAEPGPRSDRIGGSRACVSSGELLKTSVSGDNQLLYYQSWLLMIAYAGTSILQVVLLNQSLKHADSMFAWPVFFAVWAIFSVLGTLPNTRCGDG